MTKLLDNIIAMRILYLLVTPFEKQEAYKLGAINKDGTPRLKIKDMDGKQQAAYTMLHRLCFRLKRVLETLPFGKNNLVSMAAAYALVKECADKGEEPATLEETFKSRVSHMRLTEEVVSYSELEQFVEAFEKITTAFVGLTEEVTCTTGGIAPAAGEGPVIKQRKKSVINKVATKGDRFVITTKDV